jgi:transcription elongation factor/antiterminator RfaH
LLWDVMMVESGNAVTSEKHWFALYTKPHKEYLVRDLLRNQDIEVYLPEVAVAVRRRGRREKKPFFPHYLFACLDLEGGQVAKMQWTPGLRRIVSAGGRPVVVPDEVVAHIRQRLATMVETEPAGPFKRGNVIRVLRGPLEGLDVVFDRTLSSDGRVRVFLELVSRLVAAELDLEDLLPYR